LGESSCCLSLVPSLSPTSSSSSRVTEMKTHVKASSQHVIKTQKRNRITALRVLSLGLTMGVLRHAPCALPWGNSLSNHCTGCWGGGSRADLNGALKRESFASSEFEAQIHPPVANCHTEYEIPPPPTLTSR
jgi:hypothetical protein